MKKIINILSIAVATIAFASILEACTDGKAHSNRIPKVTEAIPVTVTKPAKSAGPNLIKVSGQLTTSDETVLGFKTGGIVQSVLVEEGDRVRKGQLLARLDLTEIRAGVSQARHAYEKAVRDLNRVTNLYNDSVATLEQLQNAQTALDIVRDQMQTAEFNLSFSEIHAPADGYVLRKFVNAGQVARSGDPIVMTNGAINAEWILKAGVGDRQWAMVSKNDEATVMIDAFPDRTFKAVVIRKSERADERTGAFTVELLLKESSGFAYGMFGAATIAAGSVEDSWRVPFEAVLDAGDDEGFVFVTTDGKTAIRKPVVVGSFDANSIQITKGLEADELLIVSGSAYLSDRSPITIVK